ncbi:hypothetical protein DAPPUDRAFT_103874 [Daphnia pulex]|uniref:Mediator complex subunit Med25 PTOV domain-containing protein n=1 Tax=Daphnia pulex TaxID=6669 RepID=E9GKM3_DAPPU|nr:hypothetical protein DAPPUDRAFT_103874 [Daphnia pulex]|eukprot:EFX80037.1 hypothetical protein DAPPUDRAFT_103874 [Daphnia pulex]
MLMFTKFRHYILTTKQAVCVYFTDVVNPNSSEIKVLMLYSLLYSPDKEVYIDFIPKDQAGFYNKILTFIQLQKNKQVKKKCNFDNVEKDNAPKDEAWQSFALAGRKLSVYRHHQNSNK